MAVLLLLYALKLRNFLIQSLFSLLQIKQSVSLVCFRYFCNKSGYY